MRDPRTDEPLDPRRFRSLFEDAARANGDGVEVNAVLTCVHHDQVLEQRNDDILACPDAGCAVAVRLRPE